MFIKTMAQDVACLSSVSIYTRRLCLRTCIQVYGTSQVSVNRPIGPLAVSFSAFDLCMCKTFVLNYIH